MKTTSLGSTSTRTESWPDAASLAGITSSRCGVAFSADPITIVERTFSESDVEIQSLTRAKCEALLSLRECLWMTLWTVGIFSSA
jgi:hypothetical protein